MERHVCPAVRWLGVEVWVWVGLCATRRRTPHEIPFFVSGLSLDLFDV